MSDTFTAQLPCDQFLDAVADAEEARGNDINAAEFRRRAKEHRIAVHERDTAQAKLDDLTQAITKAERALRAAV